MSTSDIEKTALGDLELPKLEDSSAPTQERPESPLQQAAAPAPAQPHQYAEGGFYGWMAVLGCFCVMFFTFGYMNAFGVYEAYYLSGPLRHKSPSDVAWIGSIQLYFQLSASLIGGPITDQFGPRVTIWPCSMLLALALLLTSLCKEYYQFLLCQGIFGGLMNGLVYAPAISVVGQYFHQKRAMAMGIAASGSALGGILFPIIIDRLLNHSSLGFGWTQRTIGFIVLGFAVVACVTIKPGVQPRKGKYFLLHAFKQPAYTLQIVGMFAVWWGLFVPFFFMPSYAERSGMSTSLAWYLVTILNAGSFLGRLFGGALSMVIGPFNWLSFCSGACGLLILCWLRMTSNAALIIMAVLFGFFSGGIISTMIVTLAHTAPRPQEIGTYIGQASGLIGIAALTGSPIAGALVERYGSFRQAQIFSGVCAIAGFAFLLGARSAFAKGRGIAV